MRIIEKHCIPYDPLGLYVTLEYAPDDKIHLEAKIVSPYRWEVRVGLPPGNREKRKSGLLKALLCAESGMCFPVRFEQDNLLDFLSVEDLKEIEKKLEGITFYLYGVKDPVRVDDFLIRKIKRVTRAKAAWDGTG